VYATPPLIDVNVTLGQWPTRRVVLDDVRNLVDKLREKNVAEAWAGHFDGLFHENLSTVNDRLVEECNAQKAVRLLPFGEINPLRTDWHAELSRCVDVHKMRGVRLHPNYHGYKLDHPEFARLLRAAAERQLVVQIVALMEDERMMHPLMRVPPVDPSPLPALLEQLPKLNLVLLNANKGANEGVIATLAARANVSFDIAMLETVGGIDKFVSIVSPDRILFGSHAPSLYFESAILKMQESNLPAPHFRAIAHDNARKFFHHDFC
jgi:uncharacterized protein